MRNVIYVSSEELHRSLDQIEKIRHRSYLVDELIRSYQLHQNQYFHIIHPELATDDELSMGHDRDYLEFLKLIANQGDDPSFHRQMDLYNIGYECPPFEQLPLFCLSTLNFFQHHFINSFDSSRSTNRWKFD